MPLPTLLSRRNKNVHKNNFGHILILAGSQNMVGAAVLCGLSAMRSGAGLVTLGIPKSLNAIIHKKSSPVIMTLPLPETPQQTIDRKAYALIKKNFSKFSVIAIGPGLSQNTQTLKFILKIIETSPVPLVIDADALNALAGKTKILTKSACQKILTPHPGEMARLTGLSKSTIESARTKAAVEFSKKHHCCLVLKGPKTVISSEKGTYSLNKTGNSGMATAGSGDVLTGIISAFLGQGLKPFEAAKWGTHLHGLAGDLAAKKIGRLAMIATDIIDFIPQAIKILKNE